MSHKAYDPKPDVLVLSADALSPEAQIKESYFEPVVGASTHVITAKRRGEPEKCVSFYGLQSAPPGFMDCFRELQYPQIRPTDIKTYVRQPITAHDLEVGWYYGFEYQKKLNTPENWVWIEAGKSSKWCKPPVHTVTLDSNYMIPSVGNCRHIRVRYNDDPAAAGSTIEFDRNGMSLNKFGDIGITTMMAFPSQPATCALLGTNGDECLFSVTVPGYSEAKLRLVVFGDPAKPSGGRLLELDDHDVIQNIHWLQVAPHS
ncbi:MAG TPA: hypothetical protein VF469_16015 [Kofleriaceae bacterium]